MANEIDEKIDFVVTWVDGNDPEWQKEKNEYQNAEIGDLRDERYREWDNLQYWFRAVEMYAPWVNKVFFVTWGHVPDWLNTNYSKLVVIKHSDYIPEDYLPTFSARPIEFCMHKIEGLSNNFVYFNDDMFLTAPVKKSDFFKNGLPRESAVLNVSAPPVKDMKGNVIPKQELYLSNFYNVLAVNRHFDKNKSIKDNRRKWISLKYGKELVRTVLLMPWGAFLGFGDTHLPYSLQKSTFEEIWSLEETAVNIACTHKFREPDDVSGRLMTYWQIASGKFEPRSTKFGAFFRLSSDNKKNQAAFKAIKNKKYKAICINDKVGNSDFEQVKQELIEIFESVLPEKSNYEK